MKMESNTTLNTRLTAYYKKPESFSPQTEDGFYVRKDIAAINLILKKLLVYN